MRISLSSDKVIVVAGAFLGSSLGLAGDHKPCSLETAGGAEWHAPSGACLPADFYSLTN